MDVLEEIKNGKWLPASCTSAVRARASRVLINLPRASPTRPESTVSQDKNPFGSQKSEAGPAFQRKDQE